MQIKFLVDRCILSLYSFLLNILDCSDYSDVKYHNPADSPG